MANNIEIVGKLIDIKDTKSGNKLLTITGNYDKNKTHVRIFCQGDKLSEIKVNDVILIKGHVEKTETKPQAFIADEIEKPLSILEITTGVKGNIYDYYNRIYISGKIVSVHKDKKNTMDRITIEVNDSVLINISVSKVYTKDVKEGDNVVAFGKVLSPDKKTSVGTKHYEDVIIQEMRIV